MSNFNIVNKLAFPPYYFSTLMSKKIIWGKCIFFYDIKIIQIIIENICKYLFLLLI